MKLSEINDPSIPREACYAWLSRHLCRNKSESLDVYFDQFKNRNGEQVLVLRGRDITFGLNGQSKWINPPFKIIEGRTIVFTEIDFSQLSLDFFSCFYLMCEAQPGKLGNLFDKLHQLSTHKGMYVHIIAHKGDGKSVIPIIESGVPTTLMLYSTIDSTNDRVYITFNQFNDSTNGVTFDNYSTEITYNDEFELQNILVQHELESWI